VVRPAAFPGLGVGGFTLVEAIVAALLGLFVMVMSFSVLEVQGQLQTRVSESVGRQSVLDFAAGVVTEELRPVPREGILFARADSVAFRRPLVMGQSCAQVGTTGYMYFVLEGQAMPTTQVGGLASLNGPGTWTYLDQPWSEIGITMSPAAAAPCANVGVDTTRISGDFGSVAATVTPGQVLSLYQMRSVFLAVSQLDPTQLGLFVAGTGEPTREMATGLTTGTALAYRHRDGRYLTTPTAAELTQIDGIRFTALAKASNRPGAPKQSWTVEIRLPNVAF
jgi:hypothetical protein